MAWFQGEHDDDTAVMFKVAVWSVDDDILAHYMIYCVMEFVLGYLLNCVGKGEYKEERKNNIQHYML